jgi:hypothetical protein
MRMFVFIGTTCATIAHQMAVVVLTLQLMYVPVEAPGFSSPHHTFLEVL